MNTIKAIRDNKPFQTDKTLSFVRCFALRVDGHLCNRHAVSGQAFCEAHLKQGYALFTMAAIKATKLTA